MTDLLTAVDLTQRALAARDNYRRLLGDRYEGHAEPFRDVLRRFAQQHGGSYLNALLRLREDMEINYLINGHLSEEAQIASEWLLCAAIDLTETAN